MSAKKEASRKDKTTPNRRHRSYVNIRRLLVGLMAVLTVFAVCLGYVRPITLAVTVPLTLLLDVLAVLLLVQYRREQRLALYRIAGELGTTRRENLYSFPMPVLACSDDGVILWYNDLFEKTVSGGRELVGCSFTQISSEPPGDFCNRTGVQISLSGRYFHVRATHSSESAMYLFYFEENTNLIRIAQEYNFSRPVVLLMMIDNYEDVFEGKRESTKSAMLGTVDGLIEKFVGDTTGFFQRLARDRFLIVIEQRHLNTIVAGKFAILDSVRAIGRDDRTPITLSVGVGSCAQSLGESEAFARQALDMSLGRGGDQAAVKTPTGFDFYGGVSKGIEKRTRVKSRVIATALRELIDQSDRVLLMGHRFGDLDCVGACIGLGRAIRKLGRESYITINYRKTLATSLLDRVREAGLGDMLVHPDDALEMMTDRTLLIVLDTHNPDFVEAPQVYQKSHNVVVIDHHRKMVNYIDRAVIFYHEPYASSASELVTELVQYMGECKLGELEAEAMLAGIMLDTKNFVIKTGVRTFEAAAYLKGLGADTVSVRKLFSGTIDSYQRRSRIVSGAELYGKCAVAIADAPSDDIRVVAPQAADDLLNISGVDASFVIYVTDDIVNISARSLGGLNAQVIMEKLGGGGHQTQAACQLEGVNVEKARQMLLEAIDTTIGNSIEMDNTEK